MPIAIKLDNISVQIGSTKILKNISGEIKKGKITGLLGPSGAGKTTLYKVLLGLRASSAGKVQYYGQIARPKRRHRHIGYMSQSPSVYYDLTIQENLNYFAQLNNANQNQIEELLSRVELGHRRDTIIKNLSGGEKTRVSLITALLGNPQILLLDEPTVGLDPVLRQKLWRMFDDYTKQEKTILVTSHIMDEANNCDDILFIRDGLLLAHGSKTDILKQGQAQSMESAFIKLAGSRR